jgi:protocatechuate 3,4-dioxygenase alpha subunit
MSGQTPSQTVGPFFAYALTPEPYGWKGISANVLIGDDTKGEVIRVEGRVLDGEAQPVPDALVEIWQANAAGRYRHPDDPRDDVPVDDAFVGFGRSGTNANGEFWFETVKPGPVPGRGNALQAPHINVAVFARGMLVHAYTRVYFSDEAEANAIDPVLNTVDDPRRGTLIGAARQIHGRSVYHFDIKLQGDGETVFFDV